MLRQVGPPMLAGCGTAKHGVIGLTQAAAQEDAAQGIRINAVGPGYIDIPLLGAFLAGTRAGLGALRPSGRLGKPKEVAGLVV